MQRGIWTGSRGANEKKPPIKKVDNPCEKRAAGKKEDNAQECLKPGKR